jgi:glutathione S-transferase
MGLSYDHEVAGGKYGRTDTPEFAALNPNRRVPVLIEGDFVLWESHAILRYLAEDPGAKARLIPEDRHARARMAQWLEYTTGTVQPPFIALFWQFVRLPIDKRDPSAVAGHRENLDRALGVLDAALQTDPWLAGEGFSLADIAAGSLMHRITDLDLVPKGLAGLSRWIEAIRARPGYQAHIGVSYDELRA